MLPKLALVDPKLTLDLPPALTAFTGMDALTQLIEPYVCGRSNLLTDGFCVEGLRLVSRALPAAFKNGHDAAARESMSAGSLLGGLALSNAGLGAVHGLAGPIGGMFPAPHGAVCAALLPHVIEENLRALRQRRPDDPGLERYDQIGRLLTGRGDAGADDCLEWVRNLVAELQIPPLRHYGVKIEETEEIVKRAMNANSMKSNPIALTPGELTVILESAI